MIGQPLGVYQPVVKGQGFSVAGAAHTEIADWTGPTSIIFSGRDWRQGLILRAYLAGGNGVEFVAQSWHNCCQPDPFNDSEDNSTQQNQIYS